MEDLSIDSGSGSSSGNSSSSGLEAPYGTKGSKGCNTMTCGKNGWCFPTILYFILGLLMILAHLFSKGTVGSKIAFAIFALLWVLGFTFLIWYFCRQGKVGWAWVILVLALIIQAIFLSLTFVIVI